MSDRSRCSMRCPAFSTALAANSRCCWASAALQRHATGKAGARHPYRRHVLQPAQACGEADGFHTRQPGILLSVLTADCLPVLFSRRDGGAIAPHGSCRLARFTGRHSGTDGARIRRGWRHRRLVASIGPAAGPCCREVDEALVENFKQRLPLPATLISPHYRHLDLCDCRIQAGGAGFAAVIDRAAVAPSARRTSTHSGHAASNTPAIAATATGARIRRIRGSRLQPVRRHHHRRRMTETKKPARRRLFVQLTLIR